jgi:hypothetical protein
MQFAPTTRTKPKQLIPAARDGHDFPWLIDERVPGVAAVIDDVVEGFENSVRQPVLPHELPDIFLAVEFGRAWRQLHNSPAEVASACLKRSADAAFAPGQEDQ